jgi:hypothetical protein
MDRLRRRIVYDAFIVKFDTAGNQQWLRQFGSIYDDGANALGVATASVVVGGSADEALISGQPYTGSAFIKLYRTSTAAFKSTTQFGNGSNDVARGAAGYVLAAPGCPIVQTSDPIVFDRESHTARV